MRTRNLAAQEGDQRFRDVRNAALRPLTTVDAELADILPLLDEAAIRITEAARALTRYAGTLDLDATAKRIAASLRPEGST